ncbi:MAG: hypothetical protein GY872_08505 [Roseibacillus sp.]|nr:hypothetical protein [Roseibacillus sp.]
MADKGTLEQIYTQAVNGDVSLTTEAFRKNAKMRGYENQSALQIAGKEYLHHAGGRFKSHTSGSSAGNLDGQIDSLGNVSSLHERTFTEADLDAEGGDKLADLFADGGSSVEGLMHYANTTLGSIRIQKGVNELLGVKGGSMKEIFDVVETSMRTNMKTSANGRGRTLGDVEVDEQVTKYMEALKKIYIRSRGFNPVQDDGMKQSSRIAMNLAYSILGAKFAMSVLFVETPLALLRTSGLNPIKLAANTAELGGAYVRAAKGAAVQFPPLEKFMSALGVDTKLVRESVEDLSHSISNLRSNSMSRFGADSAGGMDQMGILFTGAERVRGHGSNIAGGFKGRNRGPDAGFGQKLLDGVEAFTGATADLTGMLSFMHPVTNAIREVSSNQAKGTLLKHSQKLIQLSELMRNKDVTDTELIGMARQLGIPQTLAVYAAESGLLRPGMMERMIRLTGATSTTPGRELNLSKLTEILDGQRAARREGAADPRFFAEGDALAEKTDDEMVTSLNQFIAFFTNEMSPELRGTMKFSGENPLKDLLFQMLSYPIAAHQALVQNGMTARGPAMTAGILSSLVALEYLNRNLQTILHGKDEEAREEAMARLSRIPTQEDIVGALAMYGTSSPMFGAVGNYMRDLVGNPALRMYGHPDRNFPANPYSGPAISMMKRAYGTVSKAAGNIGTAARTGDGEGFRGAVGELGGLAMDISPLNAMAGGTGLKSVTNGANFLFGGSSYGEGLKQAVVTAQTAGTHQTPGLVNPSVADAMAISFSPHNDDSPGSLGEIRQIGELPAMPQAQPQAQPGPASPAPAAPAPAEEKPAPEISRKPGTGLADLLKRSK